MSENTEHTKTESHDTGKVIGALLIGAVVGAGLGFLFASEEGKELRRKVTDKVKDFAGDIKEKVNHHHCPGCNCKHDETTEKA